MVAQARIVNDFSQEGSMDINQLVMRLQLIHGQIIRDQM
jgi:hypothetical protein